MMHLLNWTSASASSKKGEQRTFCNKSIVNLLLLRFFLAPSGKNHLFTVLKAANRKNTRNLKNQSSLDLLLNQTLQSPITSCPSFSISLNFLNRPNYQHPNASPRALILYVCIYLSMVKLLRILPQQNTALLSSFRPCVRVCVTGVTSQFFTFSTCPRPYKPYIF